MDSRTTRAQAPTEPVSSDAAVLSRTALSDPGRSGILSRTLSATRPGATVLQAPGIQRAMGPTRGPIPAPLSPLWHASRRTPARHVAVSRRGTDDARRPGRSRRPAWRRRRVVLGRVGKLAIVVYPLPRAENPGGVVTLNEAIDRAFRIWGARVTNVQLRPGGGAYVETRTIDGEVGHNLDGNGNPDCHADCRTTNARLLRY